MQQSVAKLLEALRRRDPQAVEDLVREHHRALRGFVAALSMDLEATDDLAQEVFLRALQQLNGIDDLDNFARFLRGIARNVVREHHRKRGLSLGRYTQYVESSYAGLPAQPNNSCDLPILRRCLSRLSKRSRELLTLKYAGGCSAAQIGARLGKKPGTVRITLLRLRGTLLECMRTSGVSTLEASR